jgi:hypothetical protein
MECLLSPALSSIAMEEREFRCACIRGSVKMRP